MRCLVLFLLALLPAFASAQSHTLTGTVSSANAQPVEAGDALLLRAADSSLVKYAPIVNGSFRFEAVSAGHYLLRLSCAGFVEQVSPLVLNADLGLTFRLERQVAELQGVTVNSTRRTISARNGNSRIHVEGSPLAGQPDPLSLLGKLPSLQVGADGESISVVGRGTPLLYVDNRRISTDDLRAIAVSEIKTIDIIKNPPARYEAEGRTVILITLRHARKDEQRLDLSETAVLRHYFTNRFSASAMHKRKALELKAGFQYNGIHNWERNAYDFSIAPEGLAAGYDVTCSTRRAQVVGTGGLYLSGKGDDYFSAGFTLRSQHERYPISTASYQRRAGVESWVFTDNRNRQQRLFATTNLNWSKALPRKGGRLFLGAQYAAYARSQHSDIYNAAGGPYRLDQERDQDGRIAVFTARADWERSLGKDWKLEGGALYTAPHTVNGTVMKTAASAAAERYRYREADAALYGQVSGTTGKTTLSAGLRVEGSDLRGAYDGAGPLVQKRQVQFFPKASGTFPLDSSKALTLAYARSIQRPDYASISGVVQYLNPWFDWASNVNIGPTMTHELSAQLQYGDLGAKLAWYQNLGPVYADFLYDPAATHLRRMDVNYDRESGFTLTLDAPFRKGIWSSANTLIAGVNTVRDRAAAAQGTTPFLYFYSMQQLKLPGAFVLSVTGSGVTARKEGVYARNGSVSVDTSLSKTILKKLALTLTANNIFDSLKWEERFLVNDIAAAGTFYTKPDFALSLRWSVGGLSEAKFRNREVDDNAGRIR